MSLLEKALKIQTGSASRNFLLVKIAQLMDDSPSLTMPLSELAPEVGVHTSTLERDLKKLLDAGYLEIQRELFQKNYTITLTLEG